MDAQALIAREQTATEAVSPAMLAVTNLRHLTPGKERGPSRRSCLLGKGTARTGRPSLLPQVRGGFTRHGSISPPREPSRVPRSFGRYSPALTHPALYGQRGGLNSVVALRDRPSVSRYALDPPICAASDLLKFASRWLHTGSFGADMCRRLTLLDLHTCRRSVRGRHPGEPGARVRYSDARCRVEWRLDCQRITQGRRSGSRDLPDGRGRRTSPLSRR